MSRSATLDTAVLGEFDRRGFVVIRGAVNEQLRGRLRRSAAHLLASKTTQGRDRGVDGKDGFRCCVTLDEAFLPLLANPRVLPTVIALLSPNVHLLSSHLIALPSIPPHGQRSIRTPQRPGWHRDMYGVTSDLGHEATPRMAVKCAYYLTDITPDCGITRFLPGSHRLVEPPDIPSGAIDPPGALTPDVGPNDAVLFENRTWHAGGLNSCGQPRLAVMMQYGYRWLASVDDPATELLNRPELTDVERQLLGQPDRNPDGSLAKGAGAAPLHRWWSNTSNPPTILAAS